MPTSVVCVNADAASVDAAAAADLTGIASEDHSSVYEPPQSSRNMPVSSPTLESALQRCRLKNIDSPEASLEGLPAAAAKPLFREM
eukprot:399148-Prorocentrum_minimum.AAC.1